MQGRPHRQARRLTALSLLVAGIVSAALATAPFATASGGTSNASTSNASTSNVCGPTSCTYVRTGQSLFHLPAGVTLLHVDVTGAGGHGGLGQAVEVKGDLALRPFASTLEVVVGGSDALSGTTSEIITSTTATPQVLVAAGGKQPSTKRVKPKRGAKSQHLVQKPAAAPTFVPTGATVGPAKESARVVIEWRSPTLPPAVESSWFPEFRLGVLHQFVIRVASSTVPRLIERGALPVGLSFQDQRNGTATITGIPVVGGVYPFEVTVLTAASPPVVQHLLLTVVGKRSPG